MANFLKDKSPIIQIAASIVMEKGEHTLNIKKSVSELLFVGYDDKLIDWIKKFHVTGLNIPFDKFGWFYTVSNYVIMFLTFCYVKESN